MKLYRLITLLLVLPWFTIANAQEQTCSAVVQDALSAVDAVCAATGRNQACYGYVQLNATPREDVPNFSFEQQGDLVDVADLQTLRLSPLDFANNTWGIVLMKLQANLPDALPGQNVTFLMFGDVEIENAVTGELATIDVTSGGNINVRSGPSTNSAVIGSLTAGDTLTANGRNADGSWLRIQLPDSDALGWVSAPLVTTEDDVDTLTVVDASAAEVAYTPMQAFYFRSGITGTSCAEAPQDGILIQTPDGAGSVTLRANDVDIQLGSSAFLRAQPSVNMSVSVIDGEGTITANGTTVIVPAGAQVEIPMDEDLRASGEPSTPHPYEPSVVQPLPVEVLPEEITIAPPASQEIIAQANETVAPPSEEVPSAPVGGLPGLNGDLSGFGNPAAVCPYLDQALAEMGMTREQYIELIQQYVGMMPAESQEQMQGFINTIRSC